MVKLKILALGLAMVMAMVMVILAGCIEETPEEETSIATPSIKQKAEVIEQEVKYDAISGLTEVGGKLAYQVV